MTTLFILVRVRMCIIGQARGSWSVHGVPRVLLFGSWLRYCALVFVCLMQSLSYMLWMKICSMTLLLLISIRDVICTISCFALFYIMLVKPQLNLEVSMTHLKVGNMRVVFSSLGPTWRQTKHLHACVVSFIYLFISTIPMHGTSEMVISRC